LPRPSKLSSISNADAYLESDLRNALAGEMDATIYLNMNVKTNSEGLYLVKTKFD
jgi:hypothetical protein